jgi:hypothetical protein
MNEHPDSGSKGEKYRGHSQDWPKLKKASSLGKMRYTMPFRWEGK